MEFSEKEAAMAWSEGHEQALITTIQKKTERI